MRKKLIQKLRTLGSNETGTAVMEFGLIAVPLMIMLMGTFDAAHSFYVKSVLTGEINSLARSSSLEGAQVESQQVVIDRRIRDAIHNVAPSATVDIRRRYYKTFSEAALAEAEDVIEDPNSDDFNGRCDTGETYIDANNNDNWDEDGGDAGQGGARDVVIITVNVTWDRLFPVQELIGLPADVHLLSDSILANQPFGTQSTYGPPVTRDCP